MKQQANFVIIGISAGVAVGILIASIIYCAIKWYKRHSHLRRCANERSSTTLPIRIHGLDTSVNLSASISNSNVIQGSGLIPRSAKSSWWRNHRKDHFISASGIPRYSYKDIQKATQNFTNLLGQGSFGPVYKAIMPTGGVAAVKVLASDSKQGEKEFQTEVALLGRLHHRNLVNLIGYCVDKSQRMLVYEFMSNGSLANLIYGTVQDCFYDLSMGSSGLFPECLSYLPKITKGKVHGHIQAASASVYSVNKFIHALGEEQVLSWDERLQIALDISHGIEYLHEGAVPPVVHRDLKSANILLDHSMRAKVADFGLSKEDVYDGRNSGLKGTYGYIDPEYMSTNKCTMKSDIYSFGIIMFELITAIHPHQNLMDYINLAAMSSDGIDEILDKRLVGQCNLVEVRALASIAHKCLHKTPRKRPSIGEVSQAILKIKQRRLAKEDTMSFAGDNLSQIMSRLGSQNIELSKLAGVHEGNEITPG
ncbi:Serine-threonine/tyrosine-protein kinase, catalytic domain [Dillenia turbinata]|uniref:Serine-threonine/tyrosine-protein kinase, catalytic domain n=1 Tax=Dillenia turbinata TaxID=194707 RepID=A0AAN8VI53_9MAGN